MDLLIVEQSYWASQEGLFGEVIQVENDKSRNMNSDQNI